MRLIFSVLLFGFLLAAQPELGCTPPPAIEELLRPETPDPSQNALSRLETALEAHPGDFHLTSEYLLRSAVDTSRPQRVRLAERLRSDAQGPAGETLNALTWTGADTGKAIELLKSTQTKYPGFAWPSYFLAAIHTYPKFRDTKQSAIAAADFLQACPDHLPAYDMAARATLPEIQRPLATKLRARLERPAATVQEMYSYSTLWTLEFRSVPMADHARLRELVKQDLARIKSLGAKTARMARLERTAAELTGDAQAANEAEKRAMVISPSMQGMEEYQQWIKANPFPRDKPTPEEVRSYNERRKQAVRELAEKYPQNSNLRQMYLSDELNDRTKTIAELEALAKEFLKFAGGHQSMGGYANRRVARLWLDKGVHLDEVPGLLENARRLMESAPGVGGKSDLLDSAASREYFGIGERVEYWQLLSRYESKLGNPEGAARAKRDLVAMLEELKPKADEKDQIVLRLYWNSAAFAFRELGDEAEREKRMLDALTWYRKTIEADRQLPSPNFSRADALLMKKVRELWAALGGSPDSYSAWLDAKQPADRAKPAAVAIGSPPREVSITIPAMELKDMEGNTWTLAQVKGKATLINFWATWCGPCRAELPYLQKLYNQTQERKDVQVITLNMDDNPGLIEPFLKGNKYTFPVLLAKDYADASFRIEGIPANYLTDSSATVKIEYRGFGGDGDEWIKRMMGTLETLKAK